MKLLDKIKNTFFEEEYVEVEEKPKKINMKAVKINDNSGAKEVHKEEPKEEIKPTVVEEKVIAPKVEEKPVKKVETFNYFDEDDFLDLGDEPKNQRKETVYKEEEKLYNYEQVKNEPYGGKKVSNYQNNAYSKIDTAPKKFTPTPIISPIYGVLDKNYTKEELEVKKETKPAASYVSRKNADFDSVRKKAFGTSINEELNLIDDDVIEENNVDEVDDINYSENNLLYDMTEVDKTPSVDAVTLQDAEEYYNDLGLEYNIDYKDSKLEKATGRRIKKNKIDMTIDEEVNSDDVIIDEVNTNGLVDNEVDIDSFINEDDANESKNTELSLEDNLFDLIDSMYEEEE